MAMEREIERPVKSNGRKRRKVCQFCVDKCEHIVIADAAKLRRFISERPRSCPAVPPVPCAPCIQRQPTEAIKRARQISSAALRYRASWSSKEPASLAGFLSRSRRPWDRGDDFARWEIRDSALNFRQNFRAKWMPWRSGGERPAWRSCGPGKGLQVAIVAVQIVEDAGAVGSGPAIPAT